MSDAMERAIKKSAEDTSGFTPLRNSPPRLKTGTVHAENLAACLRTAVVTPGYDTVIVVDYRNHSDIWDHNLVNFYYSNDSDPTTTIESFRVYDNGMVTTTATAERPVLSDEALDAFIEGY